MVLSSMNLRKLHAGHGIELSRHHHDELCRWHAGLLCVLAVECGNGIAVANAGPFRNRRPVSNDLGWEYANGRDVWGRCDAHESRVARTASRASVGGTGARNPGTYRDRSGCTVETAILELRKNETHATRNQESKEKHFLIEKKGALS